MVVIAVVIEWERVCEIKVVSRVILLVISVIVAMSKGRNVSETDSYPVPRSEL